MNPRGVCSIILHRFCLCIQACIKTQSSLKEWKHLLFYSISLSQFDRWPGVGISPGRLDGVWWQMPVNLALNFSFIQYFNKISRPFSTIRQTVGDDHNKNSEECFLLNSELKQWISLVLESYCSVFLRNSTRRWWGNPKSISITTKPCRTDVDRMNPT